MTQDNGGVTLSVAFDYGGRSEIVEAVREIIRSGVQAEDVDEEMLSRYLYTRVSPTRT